MIGPTFAVIRLLIAVVLLWPFWRHDPAWAQAANLSVFGVALVTTLVCYNYGKLPLVWVFLTVCLLFNPIYTIELHQSMRRMVEIASGLCFFASVFLLRENQSVLSDWDR